jgi:hypothetical protein
MGFFANRRRKAAEREQARTEAARLAAIETWQEESDAIDRMLEVVRDCRNGRTHEQFTDTSDYGFMLKKGEFPIAHLQQVGYIETVRAPTTYSGGYGGVSFPIFGKVRLNTGRMRGQATRGEESISLTDRGNAMVTNTRIMFAGAKRSKEWRYEKMLSVSHLPGGITIFAMNTGKPSGLGYGEGPAVEVQFRLELASAMALGTLERYESELMAEKQHHDAERPA